jgi:Holliday junction DNA helicase RuvA
MLAVFTPDALRRAVAAEDLAALTTVPGIGRKGAQRIVLELAGRLGSPGDGLPAGSTAGPAGPGARAAAAPWRDQVRAGLVSLGWQARDAEQAIAAVEPELVAAGGPDAGESATSQAVDVSVALRAALRVLGRT